MNDNAQAQTQMIISRRPATESDFEFARAVHHRAYRDVVERQYGSWDEAEADKFFAAAWLAAAHEIILSEAVPCGYCRIEYSDDFVMVCELVIDPEYQGQGIGTSILKSVLQDAAARGLPVRLQTHLVNRAAHLYRRLGFTESQRTATHILMEWRAEKSVPSP